MKVTLLVTWLALSAAEHCAGDEGDEDAMMQLAGARKALQFDALSPEPNPPEWPASVFVFEPEESDKAQRTINQIFARLGPLETGKFSDERVAFLFKPGTYDLDVPVGYYTQVLGLGSMPYEVNFTGKKGLYGKSQDNPELNNFDTFWKAAENVANLPSLGKTIWSVSQAAPFRRVHVEGDLLFGEYNSTTKLPSKGSGGFIADTRITGMLDLVRQQQWMIRNCEVSKTEYFKNPPRAVNFVYVGTQGAPPSQNCTDAPTQPDSPVPQILTTEQTPKIMEKPYIAMAGEKYELHVPHAVRGLRGVSWKESKDVVGFEHVFVATNQTSVTRINMKLAWGKHVVLAPGIYHLKAPLRIGFNRTRSKNQVLLGLGLATLIPKGNFSAVEVGPASGVRVAGLLLQAGPHSETLLDWKASEGPGLLSDVFARVGGPDTKVVSAKVMIKVAGSNVILDNVWAWRADCCQDGCGGQCVERFCDHGVVVDGDDVTAYALFSEHTQKDLTVWNGARGTTFFYQSEMDSFARQPWDNTPNYGANGVCGYRVNALEHTGIGIGVYAYFVEKHVRVKAGIVVTEESTLESWQCPFYWNLNPAWYESMTSGILAISRVANSSHDEDSDPHKPEDGLERMDPEQHLGARHAQEDSSFGSREVKLVS